jgi:hypothetical protein
MTDKASPEPDWHDGEFPGTRPEGSDASMFIQWKGTNLCMDFVCRCGDSGHFDGYFAYLVRCTTCGTVYRMGTQVIAKVVEPAADDNVLDISMDAELEETPTNFF